MQAALRARAEVRHPVCVAVVEAGIVGRAKGVACLLGGLLIAPAAFAAPQTASLSWVRLPKAESCASTQRLAQAVEAQLGRSVWVSASKAELTVEGRAERGPDGFLAIFTVSTADGASLGTRRVELGATCEGLVAQAALVLALMIDPEALRPPPEPPKALQPAKTATVAPAKAATSAKAFTRTSTRSSNQTTTLQNPPEASSPSRGIGLGVEAEVGFALGILPSIAPTIGVRGVLVGPAFMRWVIEGRFFFERSARTEQGGLGRFSAAVGGLLGCPLVLQRKAFGIMGCAGAELGALRIRTFGLDSGQDAERLIAQLLVGGRGWYEPIAPLRLGAGLRLAVPLLRERFTYRSLDGQTRDLFRIAPVVGVFSVTVGIAFF